MQFLGRRDLTYLMPSVGQYVISSIGITVDIDPDPGKLPVICVAATLVGGDGTTIPSLFYLTERGLEFQHEVLSQEMIVDLKPVIANIDEVDSVIGKIIGEIISGPSLR